MDREEAVILVVGAATKYKTRVADALGEGRGATEVESTKGGVRIFRRKSSPEPVIVETTPLAILPGLDVAALSAMWISVNSLRKLFGRLISVVCVVTSSGANDSIHLETDTFGKSQLTWLRLLRYIFKEHQQAIMVLVKQLDVGTSDSQEASQAGIIDVLQRDGFERIHIQAEIIDVLQRDGFERTHISFETFERKDLLPTIRTLLERSVYRGGKAKQKVQTMTYFRLEEVTSKSKAFDRYGRWGPERVILVGRTGSGKSTLSQMLTKGRLDPLSHFTVGSGIRGETKEIQRGEGRGWHVVDTPGFGELKDELSSVSTQEAEEMLKKFVQSIEGMYSHFIYVVMKDRLDMLESRLWEFFKLLFSVEKTKRNYLERRYCFEFNIQKHYTVVVSNATQKWVEDNISTLKSHFKGCDSFLSGEFPEMQTFDEVWEKELAGVRTESLKQLEDNLCSLSRFPCYCQAGFYSKSSVGTFSSDMALCIREFPDGVSRALGWGESKFVMGALKIGKLLKTLKNGNKIALLPL